MVTDINYVSTISCDCTECNSGKYNQEDFFVQPKDFSKKSYENGLSGILRAKNEAEFIEGNYIQYYTFKF